MEDNEAESPHVFDDKENLSPEKIFADILKSCEEYTTEKVEVLMLNKSKILSLLKKRRPLKMVDYYFGLSLNSKKNRCLIVFEWDDKRMVRQYYKHSVKNVWRCIKCEQQYKTPKDVLYVHKLKSTNCHLVMVNGIVFVPNNHECRPRDYEIVMEYQNLLAQGYTRLARSMVQTDNFDFRKSSLANVINIPFSSSPKPSTSKKKKNKNYTAKIPAILKRKSNDNDCISSSSDKPSEVSVDKKRYDNNSCKSAESDLSSYQKPKNTVMITKEPPTPATTFPFQIPSISTLKNICNKMDIKYCKEAMNFWKEIKFTKITTLSPNIKTQKFKTKNLYKILSNFFTGKFCDYGQIYYAINTALRDELVEKGEMKANEIDALCASYKVTEIHLKFFAKYFPCRILIFDSQNSQVKKYGKWKNDDNILSLVLSVLNREYSVVVDL